jgi:hypothetical protein
VCLHGLRVANASLCLGTVLWASKVSWYKNGGGSSPTFANFTITSASPYANWVTASDVDADGKTDVIATAGQQGTVRGCTVGVLARVALCAPPRDPCEASALR